METFYDNSVICGLARRISFEVGVPLNNHDFNYDKERIFNEWKSQTYKHQIVAFSARSAEVLIQKKFHEVTPNFPFIRFPTYSFNPPVQEPEVFLFGGLLDALYGLTER